MKSKIAAVCTAVLLGLGVGLTAAPAYADEAPPPEVVVSETAPVDEAPPADPVPPAEEAPAPEAPAAEAPASDPVPEGEPAPEPDPASYLLLVPETDSVVEYNYITVAWLAPGGPPPHHFDVPQSILDNQPTGGTANLGAEDGFIAARQLTLACEVSETIQVDVYYDDKVTGELIGGGYLNGPNDPTEHLIPGGSGVAWKFVTISGPECIVDPAVPTFEDYCVPKHSDDVGWKVTGAEDTDKVDYTVEVDTASHRVRVVAVAIEPYSLLSGEDKDVWKFDYTDTVCVTPKPPVFHDECGTSCDWYKIPGKYNGEGQWYTYNGYYSVEDDRDQNGEGKVKVVFHPNENVEVNEPGEGDTYHLYHGNAVWKFEFTAIDCVIEEVPGTVTFADACGTANDTYTVPEVPRGAHWHYEVGGVAVDPGVHAGSGDVTVTAVPDPEWAFPEDVTTSWSHSFTNVACPVTTTGLAVTGGPDLRVPVGSLAAGMVLAGFVLVLRRRLAL